MLKLKIQIFPLLEIVFFILALYFIDINLWVAFGCLFVAALFLNFSLHITIHHLVHFRFKTDSINVFFELVYTILLGLPFGVYRLQHINHHRYNNGIKDITSTWREKNGKTVAKPWFKYSFLWFLIKPSPYFLTEAKQYGEGTSKEMSKIKIQFLLIGVFDIVLFIINPLYFLFYILLIYLGLSFISITNYGQHLPINNSQIKGFSFYNTLYNNIFFNNGLHYEHHINGQLDYNQLKPLNKNKIAYPHLLAGLFNSRKSSNNEF